MKNKECYKIEDQWVDLMLKCFPFANREVLQFIADFLYYNKRTEETCEDIRFLFRSGYCYYFANILKIAFNRGEVVWCAPYGHIAWQDEDKQVYDIEGIAVTEAEYFIPISYLENAIKDFKHIRNEVFNASKEDIQKIIDKYLVDLEYKEK